MLGLGVALGAVQSVLTHHRVTNERISLAPSRARFFRVDMRVVEGFHLSKSHPGARLYHQSWHPDTDDAATLLLARRWSGRTACTSTRGRFAKLYEHLAASGIASHAWDHVGHGASDACPPGVPHQFPNGLNAVVDDAAQYFG